jgi:hypothetical protein
VPSSSPCAVHGWRKTRTLTARAHPTSSQCHPLFPSLGRRQTCPTCSCGPVPHRAPPLPLPLTSGTQPAGVPLSATTRTPFTDLATCGMPGKCPTCARGRVAGRVVGFGQSSTTMCLPTTGFCTFCAEAPRFVLNCVPVLSLGKTRASPWNLWLIAVWSPKLVNLVTFAYVLQIGWFKLKNVHKIISYIFKLCSASVSVS